MKFLFLNCFFRRCSGLIRSSSQDTCFVQQNKDAWCIGALPRLCLGWWLHEFGKSTDSFVKGDQ